MDTQPNFLDNPSATTHPRKSISHWLVIAVIIVAVVSYFTVSYTFSFWPFQREKETLEGIDSDHDGVRDDLQKWILLNYPNSEKRRMALTQYVKAVEEFILAADNKELSITWANSIEKEHFCTNYVFGLDDAIKARDELRSQILNTKARVQAYKIADSHLGGTFGIQTRIEQWKTFCTFDPDALPN